MAVDGNWNIVMSTPMGDRNATLTLKNSGGALTGTQAAEGNSTEIFDGTANGDDVAWKVSITNPMPLTLDSPARLPATACPAKWGSARWAASRSRGQGRKAFVVPANAGTPSVAGAGLGDAHGLLYQSRQGLMDPGVRRGTSRT